jgi:hypothetical protein
LPYKRCLALETKSIPIDVNRKERVKEKRQHPGRMLALREH